MSVSGGLRDFWFDGVGGADITPIDRAYMLYGAPSSGMLNAKHIDGVNATGGLAGVPYTFRAGGFEGEPKRYAPRGFVVDTSSNAVWGMQFLWPFRSDYRIAYVAPDYSQTVIARESRDYAWIMARSPEIPDADYQRLAQLLGAQGYDIARLRKVPQRWT